MKKLTLFSIFLAAVVGALWVESLGIFEKSATKTQGNFVKIFAL